MAILSIIPVPDLRLKKKSEPVAEVDRAVRKLMSDMTRRASVWPRRRWARF